MTHRYFSGLRAVASAGLVAGTLDIFMAAGISWLSPVVILQAIASGLLGSAAFDGGVTSTALGLFAQWLMSFIIAAIYVAAAHRIGLLIRYWMPGGIAYGIVIFFVMNYVVVPLSTAPFGPDFTLRSFILNVLAMIVFGLIIAFFTRFFLRRPRKRQAPQSAVSSKVE